MKLAVLILLFLPMLSLASVTTIDDVSTGGSFELSNLQWLPLSYSQNQSRLEIESRLVDSSDLAGWRYASIEEVSALVLSIGPVHNGTDAIENFSGMRHFFNLFGTPNFYDGGYSRQGISEWSTLYYGELINEMSDHGFLRLIDSNFSLDPTATNDTGLIDSSNWDGDQLQAAWLKNRHVASLLVRPISVPEPKYSFFIILALLTIIIRAKYASQAKIQC